MTHSEQRILADLLSNVSFGAVYSEQDLAVHGERLIARIDYMVCRWVVPGSAALYSDKCPPGGEPDLPPGLLEDYMSELGRGEPLGVTDIERRAVPHLARLCSLWSDPLKPNLLYFSLHHVGGNLVSSPRDAIIKD